MKRWYVIQVFAGSEERVKADIERRVQEKQMHDFFGQVLVPSAKAKPFLALTEEKDQQLFPGYVLVEAIMGPEVMRLVTTTPRVLRFLGGKDPVSLSKKEIDRMVSQVTGEIAVSAPRSDFIVGSEVEIKEGPFTGFVGIIDKIHEESEKLTVMVSIFGRMTPVELSFQQVSR